MRVESRSLGLRLAFRFCRALLRRERDDVSDALLDLLLVQTVLERGHPCSWNAFRDQVSQVFGGEYAVTQFRSSSADGAGGVAISHTARTEIDSLAGLDLALGALRLRGARAERDIPRRMTMGERQEQNG